MDDLPANVRDFLNNHPFFQLTDDKKIKCTLNNHEIPCNLTELQNFIQGKKYKRLSAAAEFSYMQYEPHIVPSTKQPNHLFCKLTLRHLNRQPDHVLRHVNGKRFKKALSKYEDCVQKGVEYVPARLKQKRPKDLSEDMSQGKESKRSTGVWEPSSSDDDEHSDSEDSLSDLYPPSMFTLKDTAAESKNGGEDEEGDDFQTDEDEKMEVDAQVVQKRKKVQGGGFQKKFRNNRWKSGRKKCAKAKNGKSKALAQ
ncbi:surfeit locus protein 2 [Austrofundulus limnaeus]|uniref:Surfeit locus protein 2 n=1 Tax=Austrofundulus limnaeus TaxID=52670 RepID=A0A2I4BAW1_AUSLI|nr:PREDICTED: surfeit locus protein 2 [Austrofundulus limnaeus]